MARWTPPATRGAGRRCARYARLLACWLAVGRAGGWHAGRVSLSTRLHAPRSALSLRVESGEGAAPKPAEENSEAASAEEGRRGGGGERSGRRSTVARKPDARAVDVLSEPCNVVLTHTNADFDSLAGVRLSPSTANPRPATSLAPVSPCCCRA